MDNTGADNKNWEMVAFMGWLVYMDFFRDASFFCMLKGHTFTILDQSFNTLITKMHAEFIYTLSALCGFIFQFMQPYGVHEVFAPLPCHYSTPSPRLSLCPPPTQLCRE